MKGQLYNRIIKEEVQLYYRVSPSLPFTKKFRLFYQTVSIIKVLQGGRKVRFNDSLRVSKQSSRWDCAINSHGRNTFIGYCLNPHPKDCSGTLHANKQVLHLEGFCSHNLTFFQICGEANPKLFILSERNLFYQKMPA